jgi:hypothetical protein
VSAVAGDVGGQLHSARVMSSGRLLFVAAADGGELSGWLRAMGAAAAAAGGGGGGGGGGGVPGVGSPSPSGRVAVASPLSPHLPPLHPGAVAGGAGTGGAWRGSINRELQARVSALVAGLIDGVGAAEGGARGALPRTVDLDGLPEVGAELRVRCLAVEGLCVAWFRLPAGAPLPALSADVTAEPGFSLIPGATAAAYTVARGDVGHRLGATVRLPVGYGGRWGLAAQPVAEPVAGRAGARLRLRPHAHSKYCDRRVRVCTAPGRYREGEVLEVLSRGAEGDGSESPRAAPGLTVHWYRSESLMPAAMGGGGGGGGGGGSARSSVDSSASGEQHEGGDGRAVADLTFSRVDARPVEDLPPAPPDSMPAPPIADIKRALAPRAAPAPPPPGGFQAYPLFAEDVGCLLLAVLAAPGAAPPPPALRPAAPPPPGLLVTLPVGPVEPAPPRARELWVEGAPAVGALLVGHAYYYGGEEGASEASWVAIGDDGEAREVKPPTAAPPPRAAPLPTGAEPPGSAADAHPRALRLTPELRGCLIKFRLQPVRCDGNAGHVESSRPTVEVA